jgi:colanic acid/amylovoran biosynthesis glycosyltransferase
MKISYLINQYPKVSHSFIRREILALERQGFHVQRIALRGWDETVVDIEDIAEQKSTQYVLAQGVFSLLIATLKVMISTPARFFCALKIALKMARVSDKSLPYHLIYLAEACKILPWLKSHQCQHLHAHFGTNSAEIAMLAGVLAKLPYSFTVHGPEEFDKPQALGLNTTIQHAKFVVAISAFGRSQLYRWANFADWGKVKIVHCGLENSFYNVPAKPIAARPRLVCVGRLCEQKGQMLLLEAAKILKNAGVNFELVLAGDGEMHADIESLIVQYQLQDNVKITGWISSDEVRNHILSSQALVLPSFAEGLPVVIMEAMSLRRPVISTYIAGIPELVIQGENGWLCVASDVEALTKAMHEALTMPVETLQKMGDAAYTRVIGRHNIDIEATKLAEHFLAEHIKASVN